MAKNPDGGVDMWEVVRRWLIGDMGAQGEFQYQAIHIYTVLVVAAVCLVAFILGYSKKMNMKYKHRLLAGIAVFQLAFEIFWRLIYVTVKGDSILCWWPLFPCNLGGILLPIIALCNWEKGKKMFYLFGFVGGVLTFAIPDGIFCRDVMCFPILKSVLQHTGILLIPILEYSMGTFRPSLKHVGWVIGGLLIHLFNCEVITRWLGFTGDYMFFRSGLPFVIPGVPQAITLSVFALLVLVALCFASDPKGSWDTFKSIKKKQA
jgi:uncharacterized membrane protein YwaF